MSMRGSCHGRILDMEGGSGVAVPRLSERLTVEDKCMDSLHNHTIGESMNVPIHQRSNKSFVSQHISSPQRHCLQLSSNHANLLSKNICLATPRPLSVIPAGNTQESFVLPIARFDTEKEVFYSHSYIPNDNQDFFTRTCPKRLKSSLTPYTSTSIVGCMPIVNVTYTNIVTNTSKFLSKDSECMEDYVVPMSGYSPARTEGESSNTPKNGELKILGKEKVNGDINDAAEPHSKGKSISRERSRTIDRLRRTRISEAIKALENIIPCSDKIARDSVLDNVIDYIKYLKLQLKLLSQSRLCGEATSYPFIHLEGYGHYFLQQTNTEPLDDMMEQLIEMDPQAANQLLESKGLTVMPMSKAYTLLQTI